MADNTISPNMALPVPTVSEAPGPGWATDLDACLNAIDSHDHGPGQGVLISPAGLDINSDLTFKGNNATQMRSVNFSAQLAPLALAADLGCIYVSGKDLYYNDEDGNQVRITQGGSVTGSTGTITGLPSGTASASFAAGTFTFQSATNTPATMAVGPLVVGTSTLNSKTITIAPNVAQAANFNMTLPLALPGATSIVASTAAGQLGFTEPDNTTFGVQGSKYGVLNSGITNTQILDDTITNAKLAALNYTNVSSGIVNITSTSYATVPGLAATITGVGRPIMIVLTTKFSDEGYISVQNGEQLNVQVLFDGSPANITRYVGQDSGASDWQFPPSWVTMDLAPTVGSHTYTIQASVSGGTTTFFHNCDLLVVEL